MNNEQERLKRLRDRQLADRDPLVKQKKFQSTSAQKARRASGKKLSLLEEWRMIPNIIRSPLIGLLVGLVIIIVLPMVWVSQWAFWTGVGATVFLILIGLVTGNALDIRDRLKDSLKH
jgi:hypothetical protein